MLSKRLLLKSLLVAALGVTAAAATTDIFRAPLLLRDVSAALWAEPFRGVTTDGKVVPALFELAQTGVSTAPVQRAAAAFVRSLDDDQRKKTLFAVTDDEWRRWDNRHFPTRQGIGFFEMSPQQRQRAFELMRESLSAKGLRLSRHIMNLNGTLAELSGRPEEYSEWFYWITLMGEPSATAPWGWQLEGHHLTINYFVLGDQVVMTPVFMGSEPVRADEGRFRGTVVFQDEQDKGLALMLALDAAQQAEARLRKDKGGDDVLSAAYRDNLVLDFAGLRASKLDAARKAQLLGLIAEYVGNMKEGHAKVKMSEVQKHLDNTWFGWIGSTEPGGVFYYRIHSPVILIEFDHQRPVAIGRSGSATRNHIHTVVRTPNGNDYGKDLLRQHHQRHRH